MRGRSTSTLISRRSRVRSLERSFLWSTTVPAEDKTEARDPTAQCEPNMFGCLRCHQPITPECASPSSHWTVTRCVTMLSSSRTVSFSFSCTQNGRFSKIVSSKRVTGEIGGSDQLGGLALAGRGLTGSHSVVPSSY